MKPDTVLKLLHSSLDRRPSGEVRFHFDDETSLVVFWYDNIVNLHYSVKRRRHCQQLDRKKTGVDFDSRMKMLIGLAGVGLKNKRLVKMEER